MRFLSLLIVSLWTASLFPTSPETRWTPLSVPFGESQFQWVEACAQNSNTLWLASEKNLYQSQDQGRVWSRVFHLPGGEQKLLSLSSPSLGEICLGSTDGLFYSQDEGKHWTRVFQSVQPEENDILSVAFNPFFRQEWWIGTRQGFFTSQDRGQHWKKTITSLRNAVIEKIIFHPFKPNVIFMMSDNGIYKSTDRGETFEKTFAESQTHVEPEDEVSEIEDEDALPPTSSFKAFGFLSADGSKLIALTSRGLVASEDEGNHWKNFSSSLSSSSVTDLVSSFESGLFYITTPTGVYELTLSGQHTKIDNGLTSLNVHRLVLFENTQMRLFAATDRGVFRYNLQNPPVTLIYNEPATFHPEITPEQLHVEFHQEPSIQATQQAAIRYANVSNEKIAHWQRQSRLKSLVPNLSAGIDKSVGNNIDLDRGSTSDPDHFINGPADKDWGWDVSVNWDLSELIWSSSQTSIDSREKLMVELRDDILTEVTRLYFERRKLLVDFKFFPPPDEKERLTLMLQIDELTANIDALTGGWFSQQLNKQVKT
jgi:photosystem II stability/assembly factor-like uncharacterized protein